MRKLVEFFVKNPLFGDLFSLAVIIIGLGSLFLIRREVFPNVSFDVIQISTIYPGASSKEVEKLITNPIEQEVKEIDGIKKMNSVSVEGLSNIYLTLDTDQTDSKKAKEDAQSLVDQITDLPEDAKKTVVKDLESKNQPIIEVSLASEKLNRLQLRDIAKRLENEIEKVSGVAKVTPRGVQDKEIHVEVNGQKLARYRLSLDEIALALKKQNTSIPAGVIESLDESKSELEKSIRTVGDFETIQDVENAVVKANEAGAAIRIKDVAKVSYALTKQSVINFTNGKPSLSLTVIKKEKSDAIKVVDAVKLKVDTFKENLLSGIDIAYVNDNSEFVRRRLGILTGNLSLGLALVLLLLPMMLPFKFSMLIALGEPFAFLGAIIIMYLFGFSINLISMLGLIIVSGILVDDSIVVTENAVRLIEDEGMDPKDAAIEGTMQIMAPVTASVMTTTLAFLPMAFMSGIFGKFVREIPIAVITCMGVSLFETFFILPGHVAHWIKARTKEEKTPSRFNVFSQLTQVTQGYWDKKAVPLYLKWLKFTLAKRYYVALGLVGLIFITAFIAVKGMKFILFPPEGVEIFFVRTEAPTGTNLNRHALLLKSIEAKIKNLKQGEVKDFVSMVGIQQQDPYDPLTRRGPEYAQVVVYLTPEKDRTRTAKEIIDRLKEDIGTPKEFKKVTFNRVNPGPPQGKPVSLGIRSDNYEDILKTVEFLKAELAKMNGVTDINDSYTLGKEELKITPKSEEAAAAGLSVQQIGTTVRAAYEGLIPTTIRQVDEKIDLRVKLSKEEQAQFGSLDHILIPNQFGNLIPFNRVTNVTATRSPSVYEHEANHRQVKVTAEVDTTKTTAIEVNSVLKNRLPEFRKLFPNVDINFGGEDEDTQESMASLARAFMAAVVGIFLMLILTFKKFLQSFIILLTIPLGMIAVVWAFFLHGMPLSFMGMLGIIALAGVIVNNAIMLVDFVNQARASGLDRFESILEAGRMRVRPIFLTTITTIIGVIPTAYGIGGMDKFVVPIAMALGWGLMFGSVLTSFVFPSALAIIDDFEEFIAKKLKFTKTY
jgi:multidrug efflux pump subunit AcrB